MYYADPVKLDASERTVEFSAELCQQRCQVVPECSHFTFWPDPGTIWDDLGPSVTIWDHLGRSGTIWDDLGPGPSRDIAKRVIRCPQSTFSDFNFLNFYLFGNNMSWGSPLWLSMRPKAGHPGW